MTGFSLRDGAACRRRWAMRLLIATTSTAAVTSTAALVPLFPRASDDFRQGFVRIVNHSTIPGEVTIMAVDDAGTEKGPVALAIGAGETAHFNSDDLEAGNPAKGLTGATGAGDGDWRLELRSPLDIEVLAYIRTEDGFLTAMHDRAPVSVAGHRVVIFNPASNDNQASRFAAHQSRQHAGHDHNRRHGRSRRTPR